MKGVFGYSVALVDIADAVSWGGGGYIDGRFDFQASTGGG